MSAAPRMEAIVSPWEAVIGPGFVQALNEGLTKNATLRGRPVRGVGGEAPAPRPVSYVSRFTDPLAVAVMMAYEAAVDSALTPAERKDPRPRTALLLRGSQVLLEAVGPTPVPLRRTGLPGAPELPPEREALVLTLLMESAVLTVLGGKAPKGPRARSTELVRALGSSARRTLNQAITPAPADRLHS
ncbi:hypothetical protein [Streptomyces arboris]|uniref:hypothetical protein n=1 Tax=Streptomyces arboris TaxID=2600619 RepID=UPI003BF45E90